MSILNELKEQLEIMKSINRAHLVRDERWATHPKTGKKYLKTVYINPDKKKVVFRPDALSSIINQKKDSDFVKQDKGSVPIKNQKRNTEKKDMSKGKASNKTNETKAIDIESEEFKNWFGDWKHGNECSQMTDKEGKPLKIDGCYVNLRDRKPLFTQKMARAKEIVKNIEKYEKKYKTSGNALYEAMSREELDEVVTNSPGVNELVKAIRKGIKPQLKIAVRYGDIRPEQKSWNYRDQKWEKGVSTLGSYKDYTPSSYYEAFFGDKPLKLIIGYDTGNIGADGEMLLSPATVIGDYKDRDKILKKTR